MDAAASWNVYFAGVRNAASANPSVDQTIAVDHPVLRGPLCTMGDACARTARYLYDDFGVALDPRTGLAAIAYGDASDTSDYYRVGLTWQTGGPGL